MKREKNSNKKETQSFFERMENYQIDYLNMIELVIDILGLLFFIVLVVSFVLYMEYNKSFLIPIVIVSLILTVLSAIFFLFVMFSKNSILFRQGNIRNGIFNFVIFALLIYSVLFSVYFLGSNDLKDLSKALFGPVTTLCAAVLAIIGVHYNISRQREESEYKRNLIFVLNDRKGDLLFLNSHENSISLSINIQNCSNNSGFLVGFYRLNGGEVYEIAKVSYVPILPQQNYTICNVAFNESDDQIIMIYTDINRVYYYITFDITDKSTIKIDKNNKCNWNYFEKQIASAVDFLDKSKDLKEKINGQIDTQSLIIQRKVETKPVFTKRIGDFEYIENSNGEIVTNSRLLSILCKERLQLAREQKKPAYTIFNNQQLVALATYMPKDREEFISLYGLGEGKYNLYGERFIEIILNFEDKK